MADEAQNAPPAPAEPQPVEPARQPDPPSKTEAPAKEPTPRDAIKRAFDKAEVEDSNVVEPAREPEPAKKADSKPDGTPPEPKPQEKTEQKADDGKPGPDRDPETGKFVAKEGGDEQKEIQPEGEKGEEKTKAEPAPSKFAEAPQRFSQDAKQAWRDAPEPVKAEIHRAVQELESGIEQYRQTVEPLKPYMDMAKQHNTTVQAALDQYIGFNRTLESNPMQALDLIFQRIGMSPHEYAAAMMNQEPDETARQYDSRMRQLQGQVMQLSQQLQGVTTNFQQSVTEQQQRTVEAEIASFRQQSGHERFDELEGAIAKEIEHGYDLPEAYKRAAMLNPSPETALQPAAQPQTPPQAPPDPADQTRKEKGSLSVTGAPDQGSNPKTKKAPPSAREALENAFGTTGLR